MESNPKSNVENTKWAKLHILIGQKWQNSFHKLTENLFVSIRWAGKQALNLQFSFLRILDT